MDDYGSIHTGLKFKKKESVTSMNDNGSIHTSQKSERKKEKKAHNQLREKITRNIKRIT
jgi:hypothetical protein